MPQCPMCNKSLREITRKCPTCQADLDLLVDYASYLQGGVERAENLARAGELGQAMWAYLEVLEVDPDNPAAKKQVSQIATAVRQFDQTALSRRLGEPSLNGAADKKLLTPQMMRGLFFGGIIALVFAIGFLLGFSLAGGGGSGGGSGETPPANNTLGGS